MNARMRHTGLSKDIAASQEAGTVAGRLRLAGSITEPQYEAAKRFAKDHVEAMCALLGPAGMEKTDPGANAAEATDRYIAWAISAVSRYRTAKDRLTENEWHAVEAAALDEGGPYSLSYLQSGLTCLARGYGLVREKAATDA